MPAIVRYDEQYCPIARALDVLGDRWTLLILRELLISDQRFSELKRHLPGIAPSVLTQRLQAMADEDLIAAKDLPGPATRSIYTLTERGRSAVPVLSALAKWGMPLLDEPSDTDVVRPWTAVNVAIGAYYDPVAAEGVDERYLVRLDGEEFRLWSRRGGRPPAAEIDLDDEPDVVIESSARVWIDIRQGRLTMREARSRNLLHARGDRAAVARFRKIFQVP
ncbi:MAG TPA: helix-turn-helix domain-containing protein [Acidimicrobiales bacterium]